MINGIFARLRSLLRGLRHRADLEAEMHEERQRRFDGDPDIIGRAVRLDPDHSIVGRQ